MLQRKDIKKKARRAKVRGALRVNVLQKIACRTHARYASASTYSAMSHGVYQPEMAAEEAIQQRPAMLSAKEKKWKGMRMPRR